MESSAGCTSTTTPSPRTPPSPKRARSPRTRYRPSPSFSPPTGSSRYMVENSLGRLWLEHNAANSRGDDDEVPGDLNEYLSSRWNYYLFDAPQEPEVEAQLAGIRKGYAGLRPEDIRIIDPCMGQRPYPGVCLRRPDADLRERRVQPAGRRPEHPRTQPLRPGHRRPCGPAGLLCRHDEGPPVRPPHPHPGDSAPYSCYCRKQCAWGGPISLQWGDFLLSKVHQETLNYLLDAFLDAKEYGSILPTGKPGLCWPSGCLAVNRFPDGG